MEDEDEEEEEEACDTNTGFEWGALHEAPDEELPVQSGNSDEDKSLSPQHQEDASQGSVAASSEADNDSGSEVSTTVSHGSYLSSAAECIATAERILLVALSVDTGTSLERLQACRRLLVEGLEVCRAFRVDDRLQVLLDQHRKALDHMTEIEEMCQLERPEILELRRSMHDLERKLENYQGVQGLPQDDEKAENEVAAAPMTLCKESEEHVATAEVDSEADKAGKADEENEEPVATAKVDSEADEAATMAEAEPSVAEEDGMDLQELAAAMASGDRADLPDRLEQMKAVFDHRMKHAKLSKKALEEEIAIITAELVESGTRMRTAVEQGRKMEQDQEDAADEVRTANKAMSLLGKIEDRDSEVLATHELRKMEEYAATRPAAPISLKGLPGDDAFLSALSGGGGASMLDAKAYEESRKKARDQADAGLARLIEDIEREKGELNAKLADEERRQRSEEKRMAEEIQNLRQSLVEQKKSKDAELAEQAKERERRVLEGQKKLAAEMRAIEAKAQQLHHSLRSDVQKALEMATQKEALARTAFEIRIERVKDDCRQELRATGIRCERALLEERAAVEKAKVSREKWEKRAKVNREAFKGHCIKTGVYARNMDPAFRRELEKIVPRDKVPQA